MNDDLKYDLMIKKKENHLKWCLQLSQQKTQISKTTMK